MRINHGDEMATMNKQYIWYTSYGLNLLKNALYRRWGLSV